MYTQNDIRTEVQSAVMRLTHEQNGIYSGNSLAKLLGISSANISLIKSGKK